MPSITKGAFFMVLSNNAENFLKYLLDIYKDTQENKFYYFSYMDFPNHDSAIEELTENHCIHRTNSVNGYIEISEDLLP